MFSNIRSYLPAYLPSSQTEPDANYGNAGDNLPDHNGLNLFDRTRRCERTQPSKIYHYSALDGLNQHVMPSESFELPNLALGSSNHQTFNGPYKQPQQQPAAISTKQNNLKAEEELLTKFNLRFPELIEGLNNSPFVEKPVVPDIRIVSPACNNRPIISQSTKPKCVHGSSVKPKRRARRRSAGQLLFFEFETILSLSHFNQYQRYILAKSSKNLSTHQSRCLRPFFNISIDCNCEIEIRKKYSQTKGTSNVRDRRRCYITITSKRAYNITKALKQFEKECPRMMEKATFYSSFPTELSKWNTKLATVIPDSAISPKQKTSEEEKPKCVSPKCKGETVDANTNNIDRIVTECKDEVEVVIHKNSGNTSKSSSKKCVIS